MQAGGSELIIYHNGACSKCRGALELLQELRIPHTVRLYLADPLSKEELQSLLDKLSMKPSQLVRTTEELYKEAYDGKILDEEEWLVVLTANPVLIQRPIIEKGSKAFLARPPEAVQGLLDAL